MHFLTRVTAAAAAFLATMPLAVAHHGWSGYDNQLQKVTGTIEESSYSNPHGSARVKSGDRTWVVVLAPPSRMGNRGLTSEMLKPGTAVTVEGYQKRDDVTEMRAERVTLDGKTIELR